DGFQAFIHAPSKIDEKQEVDLGRALDMLEMIDFQRGGEKMSIFNRIVKEDLAYRDLVDVNIPIETVGRSYIKNLALQTVINFIARTFSQSEFRVEGVDDEAVSKEIEYRLNIRPNTDLNATDFWHQVVYKLIYD